MDFVSLLNLRVLRPSFRLFSMDVSSLRIPYRAKSEVFLEKNLASLEPIGQFKAWFEEALSVPEIKEPNAMCLATATSDGCPSARFVILKGFDKEGFQFYTHYTSRKGRELEENNRAALVLYWQPLHRSVRIEGLVEKLAEDESTTYFHQRPKESQLAAAASKQSEVVKSRDELINAQNNLRDSVGENEVPRPPLWGGYVVRPLTVEFWQGQTDRLHDRIRFRRPTEGDVVNNETLHSGADGWVYERLQP